MNRYIDGFVIPVPKDRIEDYRRMAEKAAIVWKEYGALDYWECVGDDLDVKDMVSFPQLAQAGPGETVVFAWVVFESREHRDRANEKIMADPRLKEMMDVTGRFSITSEWLTVASRNWCTRKGNVIEGLGRRTRRCSRPGRQYGVPRYFVNSASPAAELGR